MNRLDGMAERSATASDQAPHAPVATRLHDLLPIISIIGVAAILATTVTFGADALWLVAVGNQAITEHTVPHSISFSAMESPSWVNVPVLGELTFALADRLGAFAVPALQILVSTCVLAVVDRECRRGDVRPVLRAVIVLALSFGALASFGVVRAQVMSLPCMAALLVLLRRDEESPGRGVWLIPALLCLWGNLHGAVLVGVAVAGAYFLCSRLRRQPVETLAVGAASLAALWVTPGGLRSHLYYEGIFNNVAAQRGEGLWAPLSSESVFDWLTVAGALAVGATLVTRRPSLWRWIALAGLAVGTVWTARNGVWLLLVLTMSVGASAPRKVVDAPVRGIAREDQPLALFEARRADSHGLRWATGATTALLAATLFALHAGTFSEERALAANVVKIAGGQAVLAPEPFVEAIAAEGGQVWASNPVDAFPPAVQAAYLDVWKGRVDERMLQGVRLTVSTPGSAADQAFESLGFTACGRIGPYVIRAANTAPSTCPPPV